MEHAPALLSCCADHDHGDPDACENARILRDVPGATSDDGGKTVLRPLSPEEVADREAATAAAEAAEAERQEQDAAREAARVSARARLAAQGWTDAEIDVTYPTLVGS